MRALFESLQHEAQQDLVRDKVIELVSIIAEAVPHPDNPGNRQVMKISTEVYYTFSGGLLWLDDRLTRILEICSMADGDLSATSRHNLLAALAKRRSEVDEWREGKVDGNPVAALKDPALTNLFTPEFFALNEKIPVWHFAWTAAMGDDGLMLVDCDEPSYYEGLDTESRDRIRERIVRINGEIGTIVDRLMGKADLFCG